MAITSNETVQFNIDRIVDDQILVYDASVGAFVNESIGSLTANVQLTGLGRNLGSSGIGLYNSNDGAYLQFYKIASGANTVLSLADNVITIDAVVGTSAVDIQTANANTVAVFDSQGNVIRGSDTINIEDNSVTIVGPANNVVISNGTITATSIITDTVELASGVQFPQADGNANQILVTDGNGTLSWSDNIDISGKVDSIVFNAYQSTAITTVSNHAPVLNNLYSLGNSTNKYSQVFSTYFRGTADLAVNSQNLGSHPAANYMLRSDTYNADQIEALIANVQVSNTDGLLSSITVTDGSVSYTDTTVDIRSADSNIIISADPVTKSIILTANVDHRTFSRVAVNGNTSNYIVADSHNDILNIKSGTGISIVADPTDDSVTISATTSYVDSEIANVSVALTGYVDSEIANVSVDLTGYATTSYVDSEIANVSVALTDISVTTSAPSGNGSLSYNNSTGVFTFSPANIEAVTQTLSWNSGTSTLALSDANSIDLSSLQTDLTGYATTSYVDSEIANVSVDLSSYATTSYVDSEIANVSVDLSSYATTSYVDSEIANVSVDLTGYATESYVDSEIANVSVDLTGYATESYVDTANTQMQAYVDAEISTLIGGANVNLDSLAEVANALANSNTELSTVAFTGSYIDLTDKPSTLALESNAYLIYDSANIDLTNVVGQTGPQGIQGDKGDTGDTGPQGPQGIQGIQGDGNAGISSATVTANNLILTLADGSTIDAGNVQGPQGPQGDAGTNGADGAAGADGVGITSTQLVAGNLVLNYSNTSTQDVGNIQGPKGDAGTNGVDVSSASVNGSGNLIITLSDASTVDAGNVRGAAGIDGTNGVDGADGIQLSDISVTTATASGNGSLSYNNSTGVLTFTPADVSSGGGAANTGNITFSGDTISSSGDGIMMQADYVNVLSQGGGPIVLSQGVNGWFFNADGTLEVPGDIVDGEGNSVLGDPDQTLSISGNVITISGSESTVDLTSALANVSGGSGGIALTDLSGGTGISYNNSTGEIALADTSVSAGTYGSGTAVPRLTVDSQGRITSITTQSVSGGGGGTGTAYEYFKLYYTSAGAIDLAQGDGGYSDASSGVGNVIINNSASNSCEVTVDFGGNYNFPPLGIIAYGLSQSTSEYNVKSMIQNTVNTTLKLDGSSSPHGSLGSANLTMSLTRSETGSSSEFGQTTHAWIYFVMGS